MTDPDLPAAPPGFTALSRTSWAALAGPVPSTPPPALGHLDADEVGQVYRPLATLLAVHGAGSAPAGPLLIGITGSVAVGKSQVADTLRHLLEEVPGMGTVAAVSTDSFLLPNAELLARGVFDRKGFPQSYDHRRQREVLEAIRSGTPEVAVPVYSHETYDIVPDRVEVVDRPSAVVVEGLNILGRDAAGADTTVYVDAAEQDIARWFTARVRRLCAAAPVGSDSFFGHLAALPADQLELLIAQTWSEVNRVNLHRHILPTRSEADIILRKGPDHRVEAVMVADRWRATLPAPAPRGPG
jgi:type I pantothenate kinase